MIFVVVRRTFHANGIHREAIYNEAIKSIRSEFMIVSTKLDIKLETSTTKNRNGLLLLSSLFTLYRECTKAKYIIIISEHIIHGTIS